MHSVVNNAWSVNKKEYDAFEGFCHGLFSNSCTSPIERWVFRTYNRMQRIESGKIEKEEENDDDEKGERERERERE